jgi:hypothetical protein
MAQPTQQSLKDLVEGFRRQQAEAVQRADGRERRDALHEESAGLQECGANRDLEGRTGGGWWCAAGP